MRRAAEASAPRPASAAGCVLPGSTACSRFTPAPWGWGTRTRPQMAHLQQCAKRASQLSRYRRLCKAPATPRPSSTQPLCLQVGEAPGRLLKLPYRMHAGRADGRQRAAHPLCGGGPRWGPGPRPSSPPPRSCCTLQPARGGAWGVSAGKSEGRLHSWLHCLALHWPLRRTVRPNQRGKQAQGRASPRPAP